MYKGRVGVKKPEIFAYVLYGWPLSLSGMTSLCHVFLDDVLSRPALPSLLFCPSLKQSGPKRFLVVGNAVPHIPSMRRPVAFLLLPPPADNNMTFPTLSHHQEVAQSQQPSYGQSAGGGEEVW